MKKLLFLFAFSLMLAACGGSSTTSTANVSMASVSQQVATRSSAAKSATAAPTAEQQTAVLQLVQAMFNGTPGATYLNEYAGYIAGGMSLPALADLFASTDVFKMPSLYPDTLSSQQFAERFINNLVGSTVSDANKAWAAGVITQELNSGRSKGDTIWWVVSALVSTPTTEPYWGTASAQFANKISVSYYYSVTRGLSASDIATLQGVTSTVTSDPTTVSNAKADIDARDIIVTASKLMYSVPSSFSIAGDNLEGVSVIVSEGCSGLIEQAGSTTAKRFFSCTPSLVGNITVTVLNNKNEPLKTATLPVPEPQVTMETGKGTIVVELYPAKAPITVHNFLTYVHEGFYSNTLFHRIVPGFVIQGGGFSTNGTMKTTRAPITLEPPSSTGLTNSVGTIAMARTAELNYATSQFFINTVDNNSSTGNNLDVPAGQGYAVFGRVISGMDVVKVIENTAIVNPNLVSSYVVITSMAQTQ